MPRSVSIAEMIEALERVDQDELDDYQSAFVRKMTPLKADTTVLTGRQADFLERLYREKCA